MPAQPRATAKNDKKAAPNNTLNTKKTGDILRAAREAKGKTIAEVSQSIKVRASLLESIEQGKFFGLTDPLYLKGFIKAYAVYLGLDENNVLPFFRREYDEQRHQQQLDQPLTPIEPKQSRINPAWVMVGVLAAAVIGVIIYGYLQFSSVALAPDLELNQPQDNFMARNGQVQVDGRTNPDAMLNLNGQPVQLDPNGNFSFSVGLAAGSNQLRLEAVNKLGRSTVVERTVIGPAKIASQATIQATTSASSSTPPVPTQATSSAALNGVQVEVAITSSPAWVEITGDGKPLFSGLLLPSSTQVFSATTKIHLKTGNAGSTRVLLFGVDQGLLGQPGQVVEKEYTK